MRAAGFADGSVGFGILVAAAGAFAKEGFIFFGPAGKNPDLAGAILVVTVPCVAAVLASHSVTPSWRQRSVPEVLTSFTVAAARRAVYGDKGTVMKRR